MDVSPHYNPNVESSSSWTLVRQGLLQAKTEVAHDYSPSVS